MSHESPPENPPLELGKLSDAGVGTDAGAGVDVDADVAADLNVNTSAVANQNTNANAAANAAANDMDVLLKEFDIECHFRQTKIRQSSNMKDVMQLKDIAARGALRLRIHEISGPKALAMTAENRMRELLDGHLMDLRAQSSVAAMDALRSQFAHREWMYLKAAYPIMHREAEIAAERMLIRLERETEDKRKRQRGKN